MRTINNFLALLFIITISSCGSYKNIPYYQDLDTSKALQEEVSNYSPITIQPADILSVNVNSRNPTSTSLFNNNSSSADAVSDASGDRPANGYLVNENGEIDLPLIGTMKVSGLTTSQLKDKLKPMLLTYYKDPIVNIRILNFKVAVYGDVQRPNIYTLQNERVTITQALSLAGDLNITAKRKNILLVREIDGKRNYLPIDITSKKLFESPYFYLKNNDEIYVQPDRTKYATVDRGYRTATLVLSGLSIIAIVLSNVYR